MSDDLLEQLEERVRGMSPDEMRQLQEMAAAQTSGMVWVPSPGPQSEAFFSDADELFYGGQAGGGKGLLPDEKIATPYGMRLMRHLTVGDKVLAADGSATKVIGVYPQPEQPVYRVEFTDGASIITDLPHKWQYRIGDSDWFVGTTAGMHHLLMVEEDVFIPSFNNIPERKLAEIEYAGSSETICIAVDHEDSLYVAGDDLIVTHNTDLLCGLALTSHQESLILRRYRGDAEDISDRIEEIMDSGKGRNRAKERWNVTVGDVKRDILLDGVKEEKDKQRHKGRARDFYGFDEISDFTRSQFEFIKTWNRSADPGQRCRVVCTGNPPTTPEGQWVVNYWAAWLDPKHPDPARPGELRWYTTDKFGQEWEVDGPGPHVIEHPDGDVEELFARSRTFIRSTLDDNPYLRDSDYKATLDALPSELRSAYRDGRFDMAMEDDPWQIIPTDWIMDAQRRWDENPPDKVPMCSMGVDVAQGGEANTVIAPRYDGWFAPLIVRSGTETKDGKSVAGLIIQERADEAIPVIDMGGGYGASAYEVLHDNGVEAFPWKGAESTSQKTREGTLGFANKRSQAYWQFREALDPSQQGGSRIQLPDDSELISDLTAVTFQMKRGQGGQMVIQAEPKLDVIERLGRSPDKGDAVVMSWQAGQKLETNGRMWRKTASPPSVVMGHQQRRKNARK